MPGGVAASLVVSQSQLLGRGLPARPGGDAGSSARQGRPSAAALSPAPGTKQKMEGSSLNIWIKAASASRWGHRQLSSPGSPVRCNAINSSRHKTKNGGFQSQHLD
jgi:hypothetical protein